MPRVKNIRVPSGKEAEYEEDAQGNIIHRQYGSDETMDAVVLPSAKGLDRFGTGGQHTPNFDPLGRDLKQNIIVFGPSGAQQVTQVTGRELSKAIPRVEGVRDEKGILRLQVPADSSELSESAADKLGQSAEDVYRSMHTKEAMPTRVSTPVVEQVSPPIEEDIVPAPKKTKKAKKSRRVVESAAQVPIEEQKQSAEYQPIMIDIEFPQLGRLRQSFSGIFRDSIYLILYTDQRHITSAYTLPQVEDPMPLVIRWQDKVIPCIWAGIQFTMPHAPITFTVLLINEESASNE